jgi:hypothetical protein
MTFIKVKSSIMAKLSADVRAKIKETDFVYCCYQNGSGKIIKNKKGVIGFFPHETFDAEIAKYIKI